jgi:hypothetical protein
MRPTKILLKHADRRFSRPIMVREISMPLTKPQPSLQSPSQTTLLLSLRRRQAHQQSLSNVNPSGTMAAAVSRKSGSRVGERFRAAVELGATARRVCLSSCLLLLSWAVSEFLDGCAAYALSMYGIPTSLDDRLRDVDEAKPSQTDEPRCAAPRRPQLATVIGSAQAHDDRQRHT